MSLISHDVPGGLSEFIIAHAISSKKKKKKKIMVNVHGSLDGA